MKREERYIIDLALEALEKSCNLRSRVLKHETKIKNYQCDAEVEFIGDQGRYVAILEVKRTTTESKLGTLHGQVTHIQDQTGRPCIFVTEYVPASLAVKLRDLQIQFIDTAGNAFLCSPDFTISVRGEPQPKALARKERSGRALQPAGLTLVFKLLCDPDLVSSTYRHLAQCSGVSLRTVKLVLDDLRDKGFLQEGDNRKRRLKNLHRLLDEWSIAYRDKLRHKIPVKRFSARDPLWWKDVDLKDAPACWTGEVAAAKLGMLRNPQRQTLIFWGNINRILAEHGIRHSDNGPIEMVQAWWDIDAEDIAPLVLVYADLMTSGDERSIEAAGQLYKEKLSDELN